MAFCVIVMMSVFALHVQLSSAVLVESVWSLTHAMSACIRWLLFLWCLSLFGCTFELSKEEVHIVHICKKYIDSETLPELKWSDDSDIVASLREPRFKQWADLFCGTGGIGAALRRH